MGQNLYVIALFPPCSLISVGLPVGLLVPPTALPGRLAGFLDGSMHGEQ